ncbi:hypothetical protein EJO68_34125 [Variovorax atrisoli]|uniref:IS66 family transposase n=1 Tax=Variovorax atrisoli TaxID=3394203 RepID=UPI000F7DA375|nr:hypothetical protein EJO68_34125 [Variovorax sp. 369]
MGTLLRDEYATYDQVVRSVPRRLATGCLGHARRKFDELLRDGGKSAVAAQAVTRVGGHLPRRARDRAPGRRPATARTITR